MDLKNIKKIKEIAQLMSDSDLTEVSIEENEVKLTLKRESVRQSMVLSPVRPETRAINYDNSQEVSQTTTPPPVVVDDGIVYIKAPLVGTLYSAPSPDAAPFVKVGDKVKKGQVLCIIEAMKLMNEIESELNGVITEILCINATPVEYGSKIFAIKPN